MIVTDFYTQQILYFSIYPGSALITPIIGFASVLYPKLN